jgi:nitroreductase
MVIVLISNIKEHPRVPNIEQMLSTAAAAQNILLSLHALNYGAIWRSGVFALNDKIHKYFNLNKNQQILGYLYVGKPTMEPKRIPEIDIEEFVTRWH